MDVQGNFIHNCNETWDYAFRPTIKYLRMHTYVCIKVCTHIHILAHMQLAKYATWHCSSNGCSWFWWS